MSPNRVGQRMKTRRNLIRSMSTVVRLQRLPPALVLLLKIGLPLGETEVVDMEECGELVIVIVDKKPDIDPPGKNAAGEAVIGAMFRRGTVVPFSPNSFAGRISAFVGVVPAFVGGTPAFVRAAPGFPGIAGVAAGMSTISAGAVSVATPVPPSSPDMPVRVNGAV